MRRLFNGYRSLHHVFSNINILSYAYKVADKPIKGNHSRYFPRDEKDNERHCVFHLLGHYCPKIFLAPRSLYWSLSLISWFGSQMHLPKTAGCSQKG